MAITSAAAHQIQSRASENGRLNAHLAGYLLYATADWIYTLAIIVLAHSLTGSVAAVAVVLLAHTTGRLLNLTLDPIGRGVMWSPRLDLPLELIRAGIIGTLALVSARDQMWAVISVAAIAGLFGPSIERRRQHRMTLSAVNRRPGRLVGLIGRWDQLAMIIGATAGGALIGGWDTGPAFLAAAGLALASILIVAGNPANDNRKPSTPVGVSIHQRERSHDPIARTRALWLAIPASAGLSVALLAFLSGIILGDHAESAFVYGLFVALAGAGAFAGPLSVPRLLGKLPAITVVAAVTLTLVSALVVVHNWERLVLLVPVIVGAGMLSVTATRTTETAVRRQVDDRDLDCVLRRLAIAIVAGQSVALALLAVLESYSTTLVTLAIMVTGSIVSVVIPILMYVNDRRRPLTATSH